MKTLAPAKINWTLEVLGRRDDGYHEIRSVMQTIDLCDEVVVEEGGRREEEERQLRAGSATLVVEGEHEATEDDLALQAVRALEQATGRELPVAIRLIKRIPAGSGLGGGSSDAAAVLRAVDRLYGLAMSRKELAAVGARIGSDVPFFAYGGTALVEGRGERVTPLQGVRSTSIVVLVPGTSVADKTRRIYSSLSSTSFTNGSYTEIFLEDMKRGVSLARLRLNNALESVADTVFPDMNRYRGAMRSAGASSVHLCGAGPAVFSAFENVREAERVSFGLHGEESARIRFSGRVVLPARWRSPEGQIFLCRTLGSRSLRNNDLLMPE